MALVDHVVVVRDGLARLDCSILGCGGIRRLAAGEEGGIEAQLVIGAAALERPDVAEDPVAARLRGNRARRRIAAESH